MPVVGIVVECLLIVFIAWKDWQERCVHIIVAFLALAGLSFNVLCFLRTFYSFSFLFIYQYFRKNTIQLVDIAFFSVGAGCLPCNMFPAYCVTTAISLLVISKIVNGKRLPFMTAWAFSFSIMCLVKEYSHFFRS